jgi:predicted SprT family Zn-dependent metalloprotease
VPALATIVERANDVLKECEQVLSSKIFNVRFKNLLPLEERKARMAPQQMYVCAPPCGAENRVWSHRIKEGAIFTCEKCGKKTKVTYQLVDERIK